ncbi:MAG: class I SAM-dependent methyltransferase, partial [Chloroflexota bacterium]|nr:class I SAM-dependent methyltransferase [Chloroflexota bacterium]
MTATASTITYFATDTRNDELERLIRQDAYFGEFTQELLERAGLEPGMRVLDLGTGAGDVALRVSRIVGPSGAVVGIDREESAIGFARQRAANAGVENVTFVASDLDSFVADEPFDAIVGRMVLSFLPDPAVTLRRLLRALKPG